MPSHPAGLAGGRGAAENVSRETAPLPEPPVTVCISNYNGRLLLGPLLDSLAAQDYPLAEIVVLDDGSTDESLGFLREHYSHVRVVSLGTNTGNLNRIWNMAIAESRTRYVLNVDNDVTLAPDAVRRMMAALLGLPDAVMITPRILDADDPDVISQEAPSMHFVCFAEQRDRDSRVEDARTHPEKRTGTGQILLDRHAVEPFGYHDELFAFGWNDIDLQWRLNLAGCGAYSVTDAVFYNHRVRSEPRYYAQIVNRWLILLRLYSLRTLIVIAPALAVFEIVFFAYVAAKGGAGEYLRALRHIWAHWSEIMNGRKVIQATRRVPDRELLGANNLLIPLSIDASPLLRGSIALLNRALRLYWRLARPLLAHSA